MTDRELLELAAKGAEYWDYEFGCPDNLPHLAWNPLSSDEDAFRLMVDLNLSVEYGYCEDDAPVLWVSHTYGYKERFVNFPAPRAATRRAIVIAAGKFNAECASAIRAMKGTT